MKRGEIWIASGGRNYAGKPRPVVIVQNNAFDATDSITICAFTTDDTDAPLFCISVEPRDENGLKSRCRLMADKITTIPKTKLDRLIGRLADEDLARLEQSLFVFLGFASNAKARWINWVPDEPNRS